MQVVFTAFSLRSKNEPGGTEREGAGNLRLHSRLYNQLPVSLIRPAALSIYFTWLLLALSKVALRR